MTIQFPRIRDVHRRFETSRHDPEPTVAELLDDPVIHILMKRDGVDRAALEAVIRQGRERLGLEAQPAPTPFEANVLAECGA